MDTLRYFRRAMLFAAFSLVLLLSTACPATQAQDAQQTSQWKTYRDPRVPFEFSYPEDFLLDAHVNAELGFVFALMKKVDSPIYHWLIDVGYEDRAHFNGPPFAAMSFEEFAALRARVACDADGPEGSVSCPEVVRSARFTNPAGLEGREFYLKQVNERFDPPKTTTSVIGPIYSIRVPVGQFDKILTFRFTDRAQEAHLSRDLLKQIADSVKLAR